VSHLLAISFREQVYDHFLFVLDQYAYLERKLKMNENLFVNQRRTDKQWTKKDRTFTEIPNNLLNFYFRLMF
jgi:hypothetical protein